ncbi:hypothetical protein GF314_03320 [bacterium]|nr:hypothetical protein [bacterium]
MTALLGAATAVGDLLAAPFGGHAGWALVVWSALFGLVAIVLFKLATPQDRLAAARDRLIGRLLEAALFQTSLRTIARVQGAVLVANLRYLVLALPAIAALVIPLALVLPQLESRLGRQPLAVGEAVLVTAEMDGRADATLEAGTGLVIEAGPVRDAARGELVWRVRAEDAGRHELRLLSDGRDHTLTVPVGLGGLPAIAAGRHQGWLDQLLFDPTARTLPAGAALRSITLDLPGREVRILGLALPWIVSFTILSLAAGLLLKKPLRVEI